MTSRYSFALREDDSPVHLDSTAPGYKAKMHELQAERDKPAVGGSV